MIDCIQHFIDGEWVPSTGTSTAPVINPATEAPCGNVTLGSSEDANRAVKAARKAFASYSRTSRAERLALLDRVIASYGKRLPDLAAAVTAEMGAPVWLSEQMQVMLGIAHLTVARDVLVNYSFSDYIGATRVDREPIGVCAFITPWNWPLNQIACKVAPALAVGCTIVLKPSEQAPLSANIFAEILADAGVPAGVFNLVHGDGAVVGRALSVHPDVDLISITGSTRAGIEVARNAAPTVKRVLQELGGKSPNIVLPSANLQQAVVEGVDLMMLNSGQSCNAPSRMLVPANSMAEVIGHARTAAELCEVGSPESNARLGPVASAAQWRKIQDLVQRGIDEGATLVTGGIGRPDGLDVGYYVKPTIFADVSNKMTIARDEIFGPVLTIIGYEDQEQAVAIANDTPYGLAAYVQGDAREARDIAGRLQAGQVLLNGAALDFGAPFGGYKQSGNGREWGEHAFGDFLETRAIVGDIPDDR